MTVAMCASAAHRGNTTAHSLDISLMLAFGVAAVQAVACSGKQEVVARLAWRLPVWVRLPTAASRLPCVVADDTHADTRLL